MKEKGISWDNFKEVREELEKLRSKGVLFVWAEVSHELGTNFLLQNFNLPTKPFIPVYGMVRELIFVRIGEEERCILGIRIPGRPFDEPGSYFYVMYWWMGKEDAKDVARKVIQREKANLNCKLQSIDAL